MKKIICILLVAALCCGMAACGKTPDKPAGEIAGEVDPIDDNYRTFYQIFVGSFSDSNNDGIGDLQGIINRFDYLNDGNVNSDKSLGVQGIWLSPIFSSPSYHKYDANDYYKIDWRFGEEKDVVELIELCHERNVKVYLTVNTMPRENEYSQLREYFENITFDEMKVPVIFNTTANELREDENIKELLEKQVQSSIYMENTICENLHMPLNGLKYSYVKERDIHDSGREDY